MQARLRKSLPSQRHGLSHSPFPSPLALDARYNINTSSTSKQLPTFILFHKGKELRRRPFVNANGKVFTTRFSASYLEAEFELPSIAAGHASVDGPDDGSTPTPQ